MASFLVAVLAVIQAVFPLAAFCRDPLETGVTIRRLAQEDTVHRRLTDAYQAFMQGDVDRAEQVYGQVLAEEPDNRDALLGQAAVAMFRGRTAVAAAVYRRLLERDPDNAVAQAVLLSLHPDSARSEGRLRSLLGRHAGADFLHFALGNLCAAQQRWPEASHFFRNALRLDPANPDYAFNLAVSLEHLREPGKAIEYYRLALEPGEARPAILDRETVRKRILELSREE